MAPSRELFHNLINTGYSVEGASITLGGAMLNGEVIPDLPVRAPLSMINRHGLIAGATGTGKTKTLQHLAEALSGAGVPVLLMDMKGDMSGLSRPGDPNPKIEQRHREIGVPWKAGTFPVEFLTISQEQGARLRSTVSEFGPVLFSRILGLNDTQSGVLSLVFKYCDDHRFPLIDLKDLKKVLQYLTNQGKTEIEAEYGRVSTATTGLIIRKIVEIEQEGAEIFFGEPSFVVEDLLRIDENGHGYLSILRLGDIQSKPRMFSTFMLSLLAEIYASFPEEGDVEQPKLVLMIDEAHLVFQEASPALLEQLETIIKLIRSKGVGILFCTQSPTDIPAAVLSQLGLKIQHALRAFTANDRKAIKLVAENYPLTEFYDTDSLITSLGTGEAFVTLLGEKGTPTPLVHCKLCAPSSRMDTITAGEMAETVARSTLLPKYSRVVDRESAYELLSAKMQQAGSSPSPAGGAARNEKSTTEKVVTNPVTRQVSTVIARELTRGLLGVLGLGGRTRRTRLF